MPEPPRAPRAGPQQPPLVDGPRALPDDEWDQLRPVVAGALRQDMFRNYPQLFNAANRANLRVVAANGRVISHAGMTQRWASLAGCTVVVACVGGVATEEAYRGRGFGSLVFQDCCDKAAVDGAHFLLTPEPAETTRSRRLARRRSKRSSGCSGLSPFASCVRWTTGSGRSRPRS